MTCTVLLAVFTLGSCNGLAGNDEMDRYYQRSDTITLSAGDAKQANAVTHTINPWPRMQSTASAIRPSVRSGLPPCRSDESAALRRRPDYYFRHDLLDRRRARRLCHDQRHAFADEADAQAVNALSLRSF